MPQNDAVKLPVTKVLVVEDNPVDARLIEGLLAREKSKPYAVTQLTSLQETFRELARSVHDVVLVDLGLPDSFGLDTLRRLRAHPCSLPIVVLTGTEDAAVGNAAIQEGAQDFLLKGELQGRMLARSIRYARERHHAAAVLWQTNEQLRQSQKMEAIGRLAGGVAHDFNNLLGVIVGYAELAGESTDVAKIKAGLLQISKVADRAAKLTKQLLAFSRKQVLKPKIVDLNVQVTDVTEMLRRLLGEDIEVCTFLASNLGSIRVDPTQVEQILLNLVSNAREAMPHGGKLIIETGNFEVDEVYTRSHAGASVGQYVMIAVSDSGCGMDAATQARIFEPFFTTKHYGTGLGLATVYGAVKQSGGHIWVYSEPGRGTSFKIYFPRVAAPGNTTGDENSADNSIGSGTILLVEDSEGLRMVAREFLLLAGYAVKEAGNAEEALNFSQTHEGPIDLLLTDVVLPGMDGRELAKALARFRPEMRVLFMSGYAPEIIASNGDLDEGSGFLSKPFSRSTLTKKVREVLNSASHPVCKQLQT